LTSKVLIVDDDTGVLETTADILETHGYRVVVASSAAAALKQVRREDFDLALIDIVMPDMNGVQLCRQLKRLSPSTMVIMMTAYSVEELVSQAIAEGACKVLYKPLDLDAVFSLMESAQGSRVASSAKGGPRPPGTRNGSSGQRVSPFDGGGDG